ncbi:MAG: transglycosylase SLT domain-containing protein [Nitrospirae bacterium]|nr:transglycosylase SLT domain-containing protein [Nitrospirota bacterium]
MSSQESDSQTTVPFNPSSDAEASDLFPAPRLDAKAETSLAPTEPAMDNTVQDLSPDAIDNESGIDPASDNEEITYDVPIVLNESVEDYIEYFQTEIRDRFKLWLERSGRYIPLMHEIIKEHGLPEDLVFVALIESGFNPYAYSRSRAVGPWQFIKGTGHLYGLRIDNWVDERRDPIKSTHAAARYLKDLYERFGSWPLAMAGYNAGERKIERALIKAKTDDFWDLRSTRHIRRETKGYVPKFMAATIIAKNPERYGFTLDYHEPFQYETVSVPGSADLRIMAQAAGITYEDLKVLNPELRTELTPPYMEQYPLRLPVGTQQIFTDAYSQIPDERKIIGTRYSIRRNDTLYTIAKRFGTSASLLQEINHLSKGQRFREGDILFIPKFQAPPPEPKQRLVASSSHPRLKTASASKKAPILMASYDKQEKRDSLDDGKKIMYRVKGGDTLWDISKSFNVSIHDLKRYNGLGKRSVIRPGDQLVLGFESKDL